MFQVKSLNVFYDKPIEALLNLNFEIKKGEFVGLSGPSGIGKSTLLKSLAGHILPQSGEVLLSGVNRVGRQDQKIFLIHQEDDLFPWQTVQAHLSSISDKNPQRIEEALKLVGLTQHKSCYPHQLSGGMKKRLALARSMMLSPDLLILDEPFVGLDQAGREALIAHLKSFWKKTETTILLASHDEQDLRSLTQRIIHL